MDTSEDNPTIGRVGSLHMHPSEPGAAMRGVTSMEVREGMGIKGNDRYYGRRSSSTGQPSVRQVSLIEREQIGRHARALELAEIAPGAVRANIETWDVDLVALVGQQVQMGDAVLQICEPRKPCAKMDAICQGLRALMESNRQGVLAQVIRSGRIAEGDPIRLARSNPG